MSIAEDQPTPRPTLPVRQPSIALGSIAALVAFVAALGVTIALSTGSEDSQAVAVAAAAPATAQDQTPATPPPAPSAAAALAAPVATPPPSPTVAAPPTTTPIPPSPTPTTVPTPRPLPQVTPVPTTAPGSFDPQPLPVGPVNLPIAGGVEFVLQPSRPALHLPGHSAVYLDDAYSGEVNIFAPIADANGRPLASFEDVTEVVRASPINGFQIGTELVDGRQAVVFDADPIELEVGFYTWPGTFSNDQAGWRAPGNLRLWVINGPSGVLVVTAEALNANAASFNDAIALAEDILFTSTIF